MRRTPTCTAATRGAELAGARAGAALAPGAVFEQALEAPQRGVGLLGRQAADQRVAGDRAQRAERGLEVVAVVEARAAAAVVGQAVLGLGVRARRAAALPDGVVGRVKGRQVPLDLEVSAAQAQHL